MNLTYRMFMFNKQVTSMKINLFAKNVAENIRGKKFLNDHSKVCGKGRGVIFVSFSFYCFSLKFNNTALLGGFFG